MHKYIVIAGTHVVSLPYHIFPCPYFSYPNRSLGLQMSFRTPYPLDRCSAASPYPLCTHQHGKQGNVQKGQTLEKAITKELTHAFIAGPMNRFDFNISPPWFKPRERLFREHSYRILPIPSGKATFPSHRSMAFESGRNGGASPIGTDPRSYRTCTPVPTGRKTTPYRRPLHMHAEWNGKSRRTKGRATCYKA